MRWYVLLPCLVVTFLCASVLSQDVIAQRKQEIVKKGYDLSAQLLQLVYKKNNIILSPHNIRVALALVHAGADGNTRDEIGQLLGFPTDIKEIQKAHEILSQIYREVENTTEVYVREADEWKNKKATNINNANGVFVQDGTDLLPSYQSQIHSYYNGEAANVDFAKQNAKATDTINQFVSKNTNGRIPKLFSDPVDSETKILIAACLYFKAAWDEPFSEHSIKEGTFTSGSVKTPVKYMQKLKYLPYINIPSLQAEAVGLHYAGNDVSIFFVLPYENQTLDAVVTSLKGDVLKEIAQKSGNTYIDLQIPQIKYKWSEDLNEPLKKLGIKDVFGPAAKLTNIAHAPLQVSKVTHAAEIEINEKGTEASAVTIVQMTLYSQHQHPTPKIFHVNRPFVTFLYHHTTETVLFIGTVHTP